MPESVYYIQNRTQALYLHSSFTFAPVIDCLPHGLTCIYASSSHPIIITARTTSYGFNDSLIY